MYGTVSFQREVILDFVYLSRQDRAFFAHNGYLVVPGLMSAEVVTRLIEVGDRFMETAGPVHNFYANRHIDLFYDDALFVLATQSPAVSLAMQLLSPDIHLTPANLIYKYPQPASHEPVYPDGDGRSFRNWHRDLNNFAPNHPIRGTVCLRVGYCLTDFSRANSGVTLLVPGSHELTRPLAFARGKLDPPDFVELSLKAGDAYLFSTSLYHTPAVNFTDRTAKGLLVSYAYRFWAHKHPSPGEEMSARLDDQAAQLFGAEFEDGRVPLREWAREQGLQVEDSPMRVFV